ncbi:DUF932 domain-containing protein [Dyadobacter sp. BHUBP1]|uniref:DUF932 domain-containing protein n=1 Tax=Dyadobacter sp. BHUBP1 TaxID=3424178 RepID=UPI003D32E290
MSHLIDDSKGFNAFVSFAAPGWHGLGKTFETELTTAQALEFGGLNFPVIKLPNIHWLPDGQEIISPDSFFTCRTDVNKILGSRLGKDYTVLQNVECFDLVDEILQSGRARIETAGSIDEGRKVFICLKVNDSIRVGSSDFVNQYVLIANSHDGSMAITATPTNIRVVCNNTLTAALDHAKGAIKIRHTERAPERLAEAAKVLGLIANNTSANTDNYNKMRSFEISKEQMFDYFGNVFCTPEEIKELQKGKITKEVISTRKQNIMGEVLRFATQGQGQAMAMDGENLNMWAAYNAVTGYITRKKFSNVNDRANSLLFGSSANVIQSAGALALSPQKLQPLRKIIFNDFSLN